MAMAEWRYGGQPFVGGMRVYSKGALKESPGDETQFFFEFLDPGTHRNRSGSKNDVDRPSGWAEIFILEPKSAEQHLGHDLVPCWLVIVD